MSKSTSLHLGLLAGGLLAAGQASASLVITEWAYQAGDNGEFIEFTNLGATALDLTGWVFDDDSRINVTDPGLPFGGSTGGFSLSGFGIVAPGESVILTETTEALFRADWGLAPSVKVVGGYQNNLGRNDEINVFNASGLLVDRLTYGDQTFAGTIRTQERSGIASSADALGANNIFQWVLSTVGDFEGSYLSVAGAIGSPGYTSYSSTVIPIPAALPLMLGALGALAAARRRRSA